MVTNHALLEAFMAQNTKEKDRALREIYIDRLKDVHDAINKANEPLQELHREMQNGRHK